MTNRTTERRPAGMPEKATQAGETQALSGCVEPSVWTECMLTALERGVKGGKWFSLIDHQRWTNNYFAGQELYSLVTAHAAARQSCSR